jgi:hypothetical protein
LRVSVQPVVHLYQANFDSNFVQPIICTIGYPVFEKAPFLFFGLDRIVISGETNVVAQRAFQAQMRLF